MKFLLAIVVCLSLSQISQADNCKNGQCQLDIASRVIKAPLKIGKATSEISRSVAEKSIVVARSVVTKAVCCRQRVKCHRKLFVRRLRCR